eukprot:TRINITY_DN6433_c0_g1_i13.p2 TRINITY_DN6433_c0_g1~~TRINITY_DN6433_c0_g1_i13.p2  ORF type:complete len:158 (+),score=43.24 TRINITY_DN6433_c0_g1_i13:582-1055(+)
MLEAEVLTNYITAQKEWEAMKPANLYLKNVKISFKPAYFKEAHPDLKTPFEISMRLYSPAMNNCVQAKGIRLERLDDEIFLEEIEALKFALNDVRYIRTQKIFVVIYHVAKDVKGGCLAQAVAILNEAAFGEVSIVKSNFQLETKIIGEISFEYKLG